MSQTKVKQENLKEVRPKRVKQEKVKQENPKEVRQKRVKQEKVKKQEKKRVRPARAQVPEVRPVKAVTVKEDKVKKVPPAQAQVLDAHVIQNKVKSRAEIDHEADALAKAKFEDMKKTFELEQKVLALTERVAQQEEEKKKDSQRTALCTELGRSQGKADVLTEWARESGKEP